VTAAKGTKLPEARIRQSRQRMRSRATLALGGVLDLLGDLRSNDAGGLDHTVRATHFSLLVTV
jgi:hypothetical protein